MLRNLLSSPDGAPLPDYHRVRLSLRSSDLSHDVWVPFSKPSELTADRILFEVERVLQSQKQWLFNDIGVIFVHAPLPGGGFGVPLSRMSLRLCEFLSSKRCIITMKRDRKRLCCARAIMTAMAYADKHSERRRIKRTLSLQISLAEQLMRRAGIVVGTECGPNEWALLQSVLGGNYALVIVSREHFNTIVYYGNPDAEKRLCLYLAESHYHVITSLPAFFGTGYICPHCLGKSGSISLHLCDKTCRFCRIKGVCTERVRMYCEQCNMYYPNEDCMNRHKSVGICDNRYRCAECGKIIMGTREHKCYHRWCGNCKGMKHIEHMCFIEPLEIKDTESCRKHYVFYDFETLLLSGGKHHPNLCVANKVCSDCMCANIEEDKACDCGRGRLYFKGMSCVERFCEYLFDGKKANWICVAHNAGSYDLYFIMEFIHKAGIRPEVILNGHKIISMSAQGLRFLDSLLFLPMPLRELPRAFGLKGVKKGDFPHKFNTLENQTYVGSMPGPEFYDPDSMCAERRADFMKWYNEQCAASVEFDFQSELLSYCASDCDVIQRACGEFRKQFKEYTGLEPFTQSVTIASATNRVYRSLFLREGEIALLNSKTYHRGQQSAIALSWLMDKDRTEGLGMRHYGNTGEVRVLGRYVDGVSSEGVIYLFHGCLWHSCPKCYTHRESQHPIKDMSHGENYEHTIAFEDELKRNGYEVVVMWECVYRASMTERQKELVRESRQFEPINARECFFGGRCNAMKLYAECNERESLKYLDFCSLYPAVCKKKAYPLGYPVVQTGSDISKDVRGLLKCKVLPPTDLYHPVLPYRVGKKLTFPLCRTCAETKTPGICQHEDERDRVLIGVWVTCELDKAIEKGYRIIERYQAWHFETWTEYNPDTREGGLWARFIDHFFRLKQEASGFPDGVVTQTQKEDYIADYERNEGILLDIARVEKNPALRSLAKLLCNSHWGKFAQRNNKSRVTYCYEVSDYIKMLSDPSLTIHDIHYVNDECVMVQWSHAKGHESAGTNTNIVLAALTTAYARLELYSVLDLLGERALYCDTDSIIYVHRDDEPNPTIGPYLGQLKDELPDSVITHYVATGPKAYCLKLSDGGTVCKIRGFTLNYRSAKLINYDTMKRMVDEGRLAHSAPVQTTEPSKIMRNGRTFELFTKPAVKVYAMVYDKRFIGPDNVTTYPYGWKRRCVER
jgi:G:T-mismatch repair DNA endonuclease (very short patch repair protein)